MKQQLVLEEWNSFSRAVLRPDVGLAQRMDMRRAFYGGAHALLTCLLRSLHPSSEVMPGDEVFIADIEAELRQFAEDVVNGKA